MTYTYCYCVRITSEASVISTLADDDPDYWTIQCLRFYWGVSSTTFKSLYSLITILGTSSVFL
jgi:hypothetical protein